MSRIIPIPTTRVGDFFIRQRMINQVQSDQLSLFHLQNQVSTGRRITLPSEDAPAALRAINLQRTLQRKGQVQNNLAGTSFVLGHADASLNSVYNLLNQVKAEAIGVASTISTDEQRQAAIQVIDQALSGLLKIGNTNYAGRYIFAGSRTNALPFDINGQFIEYRGNEKAVRNYVDLGQLFETNVPGSDIFGGLSAEVRSDVDLNPHLTTDTLLSSINGGEGVGVNAAISISVTNGGTTTSNIVDLSGAVTIGDVVRLIEASPFSGANITVDINDDNGLTVQTSPGTTIRISEVAAGRTAKELGIFTPSSVPAGLTVEGTDLNAVVRQTTPLTNLLGTKAQGRLVSAGSNNDLILTAVQNGTAFNDVTVDFVDDVLAGGEFASYDSGFNVLTVHIQAGASTANQVAAAINTEGTFTAEADYRDATSVTQKGSGSVAAGTFFLAATGGSGDVLDTASGLILTNGGESVTLDISTAETVEDLLNLISSAGIGLLAGINAAGDGIDVRSVWSGADFTIGENGGTTATQLGIRTYTGDTQLAALNRGVGVPTNDLLGTLDPSQLDSLEIVTRFGTTLLVDTSTAASLQDVVDLINTHPDNNTLDTIVTASLPADGNGIDLVDASTDTTGQLIVRTVPGNAAAEYLGFVLPGQTEVISTTIDGGGNHVLAGNDVVKNDLLIEARDGTQFWVDLTGATTVQDVIDRVNDAATNVGVAVTAGLATTGNGIELVDATGGVGTLNVQGVEGSQAAEYLGFLPNGPVTVDGGGNQVLTSEDRHTLEVDSVFNTLIRLRTALENNDIEEIGRGTQRLDVDLNRVLFAGAEIGARLQSLDIIKTRLEDENVQLQAALSQEIDVDLVEAISNLTARQYALQASLQTAANILNLSILDYI